MTSLNGWALFLADSDSLLIICFHQQCPSMFTGPGHDSLLGHWFSNWGSKMSHILSVSWELVRNIILGPHPRTIEWGTLAVELSSLCLNKAFWWFWCPLSLRIIAIVNCSPSRTAAVVSSLFCKALLAVFLKWTNLSQLLSFPLYAGSLKGAYVSQVGQNADLPCTYSPATTENLVPVCWGKGPCPVFECYSLVLRTDGRNVTYQTSSRYLLKRDLHKGDMTLTIKNVTLADSGTYCCRIQFPGLMNDRKSNLELIIKPGE